MKTGVRKDMRHTQVGEEIREEFGFEQFSWTCRWKNYTGLKEIERVDLDRIQLTQNRVQE